MDPFLGKYSVDHFVHGSVAPHHNDFGIALLDLIPGNNGGMQSPICKEGFISNSFFLKQLCYGGPVFFGFPPPAAIFTIAIQFVFFMSCLLRAPNIGISELSMKFVEKVFINEKLMFTITKWLKLLGDSKIVNLKPVLNPNKI